MKRFHFDFGDSASGPIGGSGAVLAEDEGQAVERFRTLVQDHLRDQCELSVFSTNTPDEYCSIWITVGNIAMTHIDEVEELETYETSEVENPDGSVTYGAFNTKEAFAHGFDAGITAAANPNNRVFDEDEALEILADVDDYCAGSDRIREKYLEGFRDGWRSGKVED